MISQLIFVLLFVAAFAFFGRNVFRILNIIRLGKPIARFNQVLKRTILTFLVAFGQGKMIKKPIAGALHIVAYLGFIIINLEIVEIVLDGALGTHRIMAAPMGISYPIFIGFFEVFAFFVILACVIFLIRRNILKTKRLHGVEMSRWPKLDANVILLTEIFLMIAFLSMNTADGLLHQRGVAPYGTGVGAYWVSGLLQPIFNGMSNTALVFTERFAWWFHIVGVFCFMNYLPYSKHLHIMFAFPNVFFSKLEPRGQSSNMESVTSEVRIAMGLEDEPTQEPDTEDELATFGAKNVKDLTWKTILDSYTCTECGRCTSRCPANMTGKKLSPRKIIMDVRDRAEEVGRDLLAKKDPYSEEKSLFTYISPEELWACTTCNQCTEECPVNINHLDIILDMRRYLVMEESSATGSLNMMFTNIENNGAPWQYAQADRAKWTDELLTET